MKFEKHVESFMSANPDANIITVEKVNREIDQFAHFPNLVTLERHRKFLHHKEGIEYFGIVYGQVGADAARMHVMQDCGHIPDMADYAYGYVDSYGMRRYNNA